MSSGMDFLWLVYSLLPVTIIVDALILSGAIAYTNKRRKGRYHEVQGSAGDGRGTS